MNSEAIMIAPANSVRSFRLTLQKTAASHDVIGTALGTGRQRHSFS
jgi:hypothetical protein